MLINLKDLSLIYEKIIKKAKGGACTITIFVSNDADSLCALKIITTLFKADNVKYQLIPVFSFLQLDLYFAKLEENERVLRSIIFINCGGMLDLTNKWFSEPKMRIKCYVFDGHRPTNHNNVNAHSRVLVIDDEASKLEDCPVPEDIIGLYEDDEEDEEDEASSSPDREEHESREESEGEEEYGTSSGGTSKSTAHDPTQLPTTTGILRSNRKRKLEDIRDRKIHKRKLQDQRKKKMMNYYHGNFFGKSIAYEMYEMSQQLNRESNEFLWLWIIGLTYQYLHLKITQIQYQEMLSECQREVIRLNGSDIYANNISANIPTDEFGGETDITLKSFNIKQGSIFIEEDFRFMLLRHWNLYDAAYYSNYLASKFGIWKEPGKANFHRFIAHLGVPLEEARQKYKFMKASFKKELRERITETAMQFELTDILFYSFVRQMDHKTQFSASDMVYALSALLESPRPALSKLEEINNNLAANGVNGGGPVLEESKALEGEIGERQKIDTEELLTQNFYTGYDCLSMTDMSLLQSGIEQAMETQTAIINQGTSLIDKRAIKVTTNFRYSIITNDAINEVKFFHYPLALQKLANFVMQAYKKNRTNKFVDKPFVLCVVNSITNRYIVLGVMEYSPDLPILTKNNFGSKFRQAATQVHARVKHDSFETEIIEIEKDQILPFIEELCSIEKINN